MDLAPDSCADVLRALAEGHRIDRLGRIERPGMFDLGTCLRITPSVSVTAVLALDVFDPVTQQTVTVRSNAVTANVSMP